MLTQLSRALLKVGRPITVPSAYLARPPVHPLAVQGSSGGSPQLLEQRGVLRFPRRFIFGIRAGSGGRCGQMPCVCTSHCVMSDDWHVEQGANQVDGVRRLQCACDIFVIVNKNEARDIGIA